MRKDGLRLARTWTLAVAVLLAVASARAEEPSEALPTAALASGHGAGTIAAPGAEEAALAGGPGAGPAEPPSAEAELDAKEAATRALRELPADRSLVALLAGLPDSRGGALAQDELAGRALALVVSGRKSREAARAWGAALSERLRDSGVTLLAVADLSTVPERMQSNVRKRLARDPRRIVLDWDGFVRRAHSLDGDGPWLVAGPADSLARVARPLPPITPEVVETVARESGSAP